MVQLLERDSALEDPAANLRWELSYFLEIVRDVFEACLLKLGSGGYSCPFIRTASFVVIVENIVEHFLGDNFPPQTNHWEINFQPVTALGIARSIACSMVAPGYVSKTQTGRLLQMDQRSPAIFAGLILLREGLDPALVQLACPMTPFSTSSSIRALSKPSS